MTNKSTTDTTIQYSSNIYDIELKQEIYLP